MVVVVESMLEKAERGIPGWRSKHTTKGVLNTHCLFLQDVKTGPSESQAIPKQTQSGRIYFWRLTYCLSHRRYIDATPENEVHVGQNDQDQRSILTACFH